MRASRVTRAIARQGMPGGLFLVLALALALMTALEWFGFLKPRLQSETRTTAAALAHMQGIAVQRYLQAGDGKASSAELRDVLSEMLLLTNKATGSPFFAGLAVEFAEPGQAHSVSVGDRECGACFVDEIPLYADRGAAPAAVLTVYSRPDFFAQMRSDTRISLIVWFLSLLLLLLIGWRILRTYERRSRQSEAETGAVFEASPLPLLLVDRARGSVRHHNAAAEALFAGRTLRNATCASLFGAELADQLAASGDTALRIEISVAVGGRSVPLIATVTPLALERQDLLIVGLVDISDQKALAQSLTEQMEESDSASRAKSAFLAAMSHEIRTPLNGILGFTHILGLSGLNREQREHLNLIDVSARNLLQIIEEILDFSRIEAGKLAIRLSAVDLPGMLDETVRLFRNKAEAKGLEFVFRADPELPRTVETDEMRLRQVLGVLIDNAIKFTPRGGLQLDARRDSDGRIHFEVSDTGIGIPGEEIGRLFEPFYQVDRGARRRFGGTGLGLVIAHNIVTELGGGIRVESVPGQGSRFTISLPLADAPPTTAGTGLPALPERWYSSKVGRVLVVEDEPVNGKLLVYLLEARGLQVDLVESGKDALHCLDDMVYQLVFLDWYMPDFSGLDVLRSLRFKSAPGERRYPPIVVTTANVRRETRQELLDEGMDDMLSKPIEVQELDRVLQRWLGPAAAERAGASKTTTGGRT